MPKLCISNVAAEGYQLISHFLSFYIEQSNYLFLSYFTILNNE